MGTGLRLDAERACLFDGLLASRSKTTRDVRGAVANYRDVRLGVRILKAWQVFQAPTRVGEGETVSGRVSDQTIAVAAAALSELDATQDPSGFRQRARQALVLLGKLAFTSGNAQRRECEPACDPSHVPSSHGNEADG
jgi:hypothetical protein